MLCAVYSHLPPPSSATTVHTAYSPQWTPSDEKVLERVKETGTLEGEKSYGDEAHHEEMDEKAKVLLGNTAHLSGLDRKKNNGETWNLSETLRYVLALLHCTWLSRDR
jgi:hypothetical protein